jgi:hypothetical protein
MLLVCAKLTCCTIDISVCHHLLLLQSSLSADIDSDDANNDGEPLKAAACAKHFFGYVQLPLYSITPGQTYML